MNGNWKSRSRLFFSLVNAEDICAIVDNLMWKKTSIREESRDLSQKGRNWNTAKRVVSSIRKHFKVFRVIAWRKKTKKIKNRRIHAFAFIHFTSSTLCQISNFKTTAVNDKKESWRQNAKKTAMCWCLTAFLWPRRRFLPDRYVKCLFRGVENGTEIY